MDDCFVLDDDGVKELFNFFTDRARADNSLKISLKVALTLSSKLTPGCSETREERVLTRVRMVSTSCMIAELEVSILEVVSGELISPEDGTTSKGPKGQLRIKRRYLLKRS